MQFPQSKFAPRRVASALVAVFLALAAGALPGGCGKGPVAADRTPPPSAPHVVFEIFVQGQITASQGDYIIALNCDTDPASDVNGAFSEVPGEPYASEAQQGTYAHWDQEFVYGSDTLAKPNGFLYAYKVLTGSSTTGISVAFIPILLNANDFQFIPNASANGQTGNALSIQLPIADLSIRANASGTGTITTPPVVQVYVNYITTDTGHVPQDALGCCGVNSTSFQLIIPLTVGATYVSQLTTPPGKQGGPANPNLYITGGEIIVTP
jgi:hypothetical protein